MFRFIFGLTALWLFSLAPAAYSAEKPNIVLIYADDK